MSEQEKPAPKQMSRRQALSMLGLAAATAYVVPTVLTVSDAEAGAVHRSRRRRRSHPDWWYRRRRRSHPDWWYRRRHRSRRRSKY
jgi:hypothetical protein